MMKMETFKLKRLKPSQEHMPMPFQVRNPLPSSNLVSTSDSHLECAPFLNLALCRLQESSKAPFSSFSGFRRSHLLNLTLHPQNAIFVFWFFDVLTFFF